MVKKGLEHYSRTDAGALYTFEWYDDHESEILGGQKIFPSPMHEEPLKLLPIDVRKTFIEEINKGRKDGYKINIKGEVCPADRYILGQYLQKYNGDWKSSKSH